MKKYEYMVTSIVIKKADEMAKVLSDKFNQYGFDGWELVQYNLIPPSALVTASTIPCCGSIYILATFKKRLEKQHMKKISFNLEYLITKYDWCFYFFPSLIVWKPYSGVYEINVAFLLWEFNIKYQLKRNKQ